MAIWIGIRNPFTAPMERSVTNADNIIIYHLFRLNVHKTEGAWQLAMYNDFATPANAFISAVGTLSGDKEAQTVLTSAFESVFKDMPSQLDIMDDLTRLVHAVNSDPYKLIWGRTRDRFYMGSYSDRIAALLGLANEMTAQTVPDGATAALAYKASIETAHADQQNRMTKVGTDSSSVEALRQTLIKKLNKNRGILISNFAELSNYDQLMEGYFPLNLLGDHAAKGHYQLIIPSGEFRKICIHTFKANEKIDIVGGDTDVWISTADNANNPISSGYKAVAGVTTRISPSELGDLTKKYVIATNNNLTTSCDLIFNIVKV